MLDFADVYDRMMANGYYINQLQVSVMTVIVNPILPKLWKDVVARGGPLRPPLIFSVLGLPKGQN